MTPAIDLTTTAVVDLLHADYTLQPVGDHVARNGVFPTDSGIYDIIGRPVGTLSTGESVVLHAARALWSGNGQLGHVAARLDHHRQLAVIRALATVAGLKVVQVDAASEIAALSVVAPAR